MLEARNDGPPFTTDPTAANVDLHTSQRLLAKIANNTTTRSHVFGIWIGYRMFEAHQTTINSRVQIGAALSDQPLHVDFMVVDMSRLEEAFDPRTNTFDWHQFVIYRKTVQ